MIETFKWVDGPLERLYHLDRDVQAGRSKPQDVEELAVNVIKLMIFLGELTLKYENYS